MAQSVTSDGLFVTEGRVNWIPLRTIVVLRWIAVAGQTAALAVAITLFHLDLPAIPAVLAIGAAAAANLLALARHRPVARLSEAEARRHLMFDVVQLTALLALTGGLHNPFALMMMVPVTVSATALRGRTTAALAALAVLGVTAVGAWHVPLRAGEAVLRLEPTFLAGFWTAIVIGIVFVAAYVQRVASGVAEMTEALAATRAALDREHRTGEITGLIAAAAHELGTPLATITVAAAELLDEFAGHPHAAEDLRLIRAQADRCRDILREMGRTGAGAPPVGAAPVEAWLREAARPHEGRGPRLVWDVAPAGDGPSRQPVVPRRPEIVHGLRNIIQNAVDHAEREVTILLRWDAGEVRVVIEDDGPGFPPEVLARIGDPFLRGRSPSRGAEGLGLGLFIALTLLERSGARIEAANRTRRRGGAVSVVWPSDALLLAGVAETGEPTTMG